LLKIHLKRALSNLIRAKRFIIVDQTEIIIMKHLIFLATLLFLGLSFQADAQEKRRGYVNVKGNITDHKDRPIKNAIIFVDMVKTNVKTNKKGDYKIKVAPLENLLSVYHPSHGFINWKYNGEKKVNFVYPDKTDALTQEEMEELGFNFKKREKNWYGGFGNVLDILDSKFTNARVTKEGNIIVGRIGTGVVTGDTRPLILVNDVPTDVSQLDVIPTTEIESIRVLDKGTDTAPYGFRGANGVIIIKLKTGKSDISKN